MAVHPTLRKSHKTVPDHPLSQGRHRCQGSRTQPKVILRRRAGASASVPKAGGAVPGSEQLLTKKIWMQNKDHPDAEVFSPPSGELSSEPGSARAPQPECRPASTPGTACWGCPPSLGQRSPPTRRLWAGSGPTVTALGQKLSSAAQSCLTLCDPMDSSTPGFPVHHQLRLLKLMSLESVMPSNHLILRRSLLLPPSIFPSIRVFSSELALRIR